MGNLALGLVARELSLTDETGETTGGQSRDAEFDASRVFDREPVSPDAERQQHLSVTYCRENVDALEVLLTQSKRELQDAVYYCNQKAWGYWDAKAKAPTHNQSAALLDRMDSKFAQVAREAHHLRALCADVSAALEKAQAKALEEMNERGRKDQEAEDWATFEAHEASERRRRFKAWKERRLP